MKNKENLFLKNNYDVQIEEILEQKQFNDEAKSLILNTLYKIESGYKDYSKIKSGVKLKNDIINDIIDIIKNDCDNIEIIDPNNSDSKNKFLINRKSKSIKVFPNEVSLMKALYYIHMKDSKNISNIFEKSITAILERGKAINEVEIIRDFNGWSWNNSIENSNNMFYNLLYQDLVILLGNDCVDNILKRCKIIKGPIKFKLKEAYGEKKAEQVFSKIEKCCILMYININEKNEEELYDYLKAKQKELYQITDKANYITNITNENNKNIKIITKIDTILKNEKILKRKFTNSTIKEKYKTIENYKKYLQEAKEYKENLISKNTQNINPFQYVKIKNNLEKEVKLLTSIKVLSEQKNSLYTNLIELQRKIILSFHKKIEVYDLKKELINLVSEIRYYNYLPISNTNKIMNLDELDVDLKNMQKKLISKLCQNKVIDVFAKDYNLNYKILKYIFITSMTNITKIQLKLKHLGDNLVIEYYDENVLENEVTINISEKDLNEISKKLDKKIKIFI